jgi:hypothetical protein
MATIDPSIALSIKPIQIQDPLNRMAAMMQLEGGQQTQQLNALKIREAEQDIENRNALRNIPGGINDPDYISNVAKYNPELAVKLQKDLAAFKTSGLQTTELQNKIKEQERNENREAFKSLVFNPSDNNILAYLEDSVLKKKITPEQKEQQWATVKDMTPEQRIPHFTMLGTKADEFFKQQALNAAPTTAMKEFQFSQQNPNFLTYQTGLKRAGSTQVNLPTQEKEFEKTLGGKQAETLIKSKEGAMDAASILQTNEVGRNLLKSGAITGAGADFFVGLNQALKTAGIDAGYADASANSQAYAAAMGQNTAKLIKQFGAGTGLSDADRMYAEKIAAGKITMDEKAIRKVLDINDTAARNVIKLHNRSVEGIKTNIPLKVDMPRGEPVKTGKVTSGPNAGKTVIEYADGTREYQ